MMQMLSRLVACALAALLTLAPPAVALAQQKPVPPDHAQRMKQGTELFRQHVRQVLLDHCAQCHAGENVKADFDLSTRESLMASGMVGEDAASSHLMALIRHEEEPHMPQKADKLSDETIAQIAQWIELGAPYDKPLVDGQDDGPQRQGPTEAERKFWSFQPLAVVAPPQVKDEQWPRGAIDQFILARLEQEGLHPNPPADRRVLIRRAYFDLLGLPPTPEEIEQFVNDPDPQAYDKLLDRLLESPHYGERWARHWMDIARFAESHGYEQDYDRPYAYHYRDFLIQALNADMPYDQFVRWQLAGDELAPEEPLALMATGFLGAGAFPTQLTEAEFESARYDELDDMVSTLGTAVLGLSVGCARCHDHKFDPISSKEYYQLASVFTKTIRSEIPLNLEPEKNQQRREEYEARGRQLAAELQQYEQRQLPADLQAWLQTGELEQLGTSAWQSLRIENIESSSGTQLQTLEDGSLLASGAAPAQDVMTITAVAARGPIAALRIEALTHASLPQQGPGRAPNGNFVLSDITIEAASSDAAGPLQKLALREPRATHQQNDSDLSVAASVDDNPVSGWAVDQGGIGKDQAAVFALAEPIASRSSAVRLKITLAFNHPNPQHAIGRFRLSVSQQPAAPIAEDAQLPDEDVRAALLAMRQSFKADSQQGKVALRWFAARQSRWQELKRALDEHEKAGPPLEFTTVQVTSEGFKPMKHNADDRGFPHFYPETFVLTRGDVHQKQEPAAPGYLQVLMTPGTSAQHWQMAPPGDWTRTSYQRASLANWITDVRHGGGALAARVIVNRLWQHHFGRGIVATPSDFGLQGDPPTHPELLEWLAADLVHHGWKLNRLHKLIMTSSAYMQDGQYDEARASIDRENMLLWRRAPQRLEAEAIRDAMLHVSGLLDPTMFGPGTLDQNMRRRSVYFFIKRSKLIPMMMLFDWPEHLVGIGQRSSTTIAPQALMFMNSPEARQYAEGLAQRVQSLPATEAIQRAYAIAVGRHPTGQETQLAEAFLQQQRERYAGEDSQVAANRAWVDLCQALLSTNEFVYIE